MGTPGILDHKLASELDPQQVLYTQGLNSALAVWQEPEIGICGP